MSPTLISTQRKRRTLPPHGFEGRRADTHFVAPVLPEPKAIELPSDDDLARLGFTFEGVGFGGTTVRLFHHGRAMGVFGTRAAAAPTIKRYSA